VPGAGRPGSKLVPRLYYGAASGATVGPAHVGSTYDPGTSSASLVTPS
jgi:hypothetical protein